MHVSLVQTGHLNDEKSWGVNPRALHDLFKIKEERAKEGTHFEVSIKMVEIYNNRVRDLFDSAHKEYPCYCYICLFLFEYKFSVTSLEAL